MQAQQISNNPNVMNKINDSQQITQQLSSVGRSFLIWKTCLARARFTVNEKCDLDL